MSKLLIISNLVAAISRPTSWMFCSQVWQVCQHISQVAAKYDDKIVLNENHRLYQEEFDYLPPHCDTVRDTQPLKVDIGQHQRFEVSRFNPFTDNHLQILIQPYDEIALCGFNASFNIIPMAIGLIDLRKKISIIPKAIGCITEDRKERAINYMVDLGIEVQDG